MLPFARFSDWLKCRPASKPIHRRVLGFEGMESRCLLSTFEGQTSAVFAELSPSQAVATVSGGNVTYGRPFSEENGGQSSLKFSLGQFAADSGEVFSLGEVSF